MGRKGCKPPVRHLTQIVEVGGGGGRRAEQFQPGRLSGSLAEEPEDGTLTGRKQLVRAAARLPSLFLLLFFPPNRCGETRWTRAACTECERWPSS